MSKDMKAAFGAAIALALFGSAADAATVIDQRVVDTKTDLVDTTTTIVEEKGVRYKVTDEKYRVTTTTKRTLQDSYRSRVYNHRDYDYRVSAGFTNTDGKWYEFNIDQDSALAEGNRSVTWGKSTRSSFDFDTRRGNADTGQRVTLGTFTHDNQRVVGGIQGTDLNIGLDLYLDGGRQRFDWTFDVTHAETWNWFRDVDDKVSISDERFTRSFRIADVDYTFSLLGFFGSYGYDQAWHLAEQSRTSRDLLATLSSVEWKTFYKTSTDFLTSVDHFTKTSRMELPSEVPLPAGLPLLLGGLGLIGVMKRRQNKV